MTCEGCLYLSPIGPPWWCAHSQHFGYMPEADRSQCLEIAFTPREQPELPNDAKPD